MGPGAIPPIVYFNIGWMKYYSGPLPDDPTVGAHGYLKDHVHGAEAFNFLKTNAGTVLGYRPPGGGEKTNITRMGAKSQAGSIGNALVVWLAREPGSRRTLVVGWYRNATVLRVAQESQASIDNEAVFYTAEAQAKDATLLPLHLRTFEVRSSRTEPGGGFGQKPTWYGTEAVDDAVWAYVTSFDLAKRRASQSGPPNPPRNTDPDLRRKVEKAAVFHAINYFKGIYGNGCSIRSVELDAKGWDLEVLTDAQPLLIEVKGLANSAIVCELTPNEYEKMMLPENKERYVVYIVNNALAEQPEIPVASIFRYSGGKIWRTADGRTLNIRPKTAAVLSCL